VGISTIADLNEADVVVSDDGLPGHAMETLAEQVGEVLLAETVEAEEA
jgi:hypothetical protein